MARDGAHFKVRDFACKCGCGTNKTSDDLMRLCDKIRSIAGIPLYVNSGTRCAKRNRECGGVQNSNHMTGQAADLSPRGAMPIGELHRIVLSGYSQGILPELAGLGLYPDNDFIHVDTSPRQRGRLRQWTERRR